MRKELPPRLRANRIGMAPTADAAMIARGDDEIQKRGKKIFSRTDCQRRKNERHALAREELPHGLDELLTRMYSAHACPYACRARAIVVAVCVYLYVHV